MTLARRHMLKLAGAAVAAPAVSRVAWGQAQVTLKLHHFLPPVSNGHSKLLAPWARKVEADSGNRIKIDIFPSMQLGGTQPQLYDQARDGVVDFIWTVLGSTPGRFPRTEVFELPFVAAKRGVPNAKAVQEFYETAARDEFKDVQPICVWAHDHGLVHTHRQIKTMEDLKGLKLRSPTRLAGEALKALGANGIPLPIPQLPFSPTARGQARIAPARTSARPRSALRAGRRSGSPSSERSSPPPASPLRRTSESAALRTARTSFPSTVQRYRYLADTLKSGSSVASEVQTRHSTGDRGVGADGRSSTEMELGGRLRVRVENRDDPEAGVHQDCAVEVDDDSPDPRASSAPGVPRTANSRARAQARAPPAPLRPADRPDRGSGCAAAPRPVRRRHRPRHVRTPCVLHGRTCRCGAPGRAAGRADRSCAGSRSRRP